MAKEYIEVIMTGSFDVVKGFVCGYFLGAGVTRRPFFHVKSGTIRHDTLIGNIKSLLSMENKVPFCMETGMWEDFKKAETIAEHRLGIAIKEVKKIVHAEFDFHHEIFNKERAQTCKDMLNHPPEEVELVSYNPIEEKHEEYPTLTLGSLAHSYSYTGKGSVRGPFESVVNLFLTIKESKCCEHIECRHLQLKLEDWHK